MIRCKDSLPDEQKAVAECFTGDPALPNFAILTPNLRRLRFNVNPCFFCQFGSSDCLTLVLPPTLDTLEFGDISGRAILKLLNAIPTTLGCLTLPAPRKPQLSPAEDLVNPIFARFTQLRTLKLSGTSKGRGASVPHSLTDLSAWQFWHYPIDMFMSMRAGSLTSLDIQLVPALEIKYGAEASTIDFASSMPPTMRILRLNILPPPKAKPTIAVTIASLPPQLTELRLHLNYVLPPLLRALSSLNALENLTLSTGLPPSEFELVPERAYDAPAHLLSLKELPPNLKALSLLGGAFKHIASQPKLIPAFPPSLESLTTAADLSWARQFRETHPNTSITFTSSINVTGDGDGLLLQSEFPDFWSTSFDNEA